MKRLGTLVESQQSDGACAALVLKHPNPYIQKMLELKNYALTPSDLEKGLENIFQDLNRELIIEIGCYFGKTLIELSKLLPAYNILGIDITYKRVAKTAIKIKNNNFDNTKVAIADGMSLLKYLPDQSISGVCVFFPDPWPKKRHIKNRLLSENFFSLLRQKIKKQGFVFIKTDQSSYFKFACDAAISQGFIQKPGVPLAEVFVDGTLVTEFQNTFMRQNIPFYSAYFEAQ